MHLLQVATEAATTVLASEAAMATSSEVVIAVHLFHFVASSEAVLAPPLFDVAASYLGVVQHLSSAIVERMAVRILRECQIFRIA